jgi:hypothetical protein
MLIPGFTHESSSRLSLATADGCGHPRGVAYDGFLALSFFGTLTNMERIHRSMAAAADGRRAEARSPDRPIDEWTGGELMMALCIGLLSRHTFCLGDEVTGEFVYERNTGKRLQK